MRKILLAITIMAMSTAAYAYCRTNVIMLPDGSTVVCMTCCSSAGNCTTTCN